jgi:hypothetical protein
MISPSRPWSRFFLAFTFSLVLAAAGAGGAQAQEATPSIASASLRLWPEYDDPGLLVIFSGDLDPNATYPATVTIPVPIGARNIQATYQDPASGSLMTRPWEIKDGKLTYQVPSPSFHVEYYLDRAPSGDARDLTFSFVAPAAIGALEVQAQAPARSVGFALSPESESSAAGADGLTYHTLRRAGLKPGEMLNLGLRYTKPDQGLSSPQLAVPQQVGATPAPVEPITRAGNPWLPFLLIGAGLAALAALGMWWFLQRRAEAAPAASRPPQRSLRATAPSRQVEGRATAFCTACGAALREGDRFCAQCGTPSRP